jgi:hypothetical protein
MPVKKRMAKKRPVEEIREAWADYFCSGRQMLNGTLEWLGEDTANVEAAWREYGKWFLAEGRGVGGREIDTEDSWAFQKFGAP